MSNSAVKVERLTKFYGDPAEGGVIGCQDVSFEAAYGSVFGLLGTNGAGKTTTLRMLATMLKPSSGRGMIAGHDLVENATAVRERIGFLSASTGVYGRLTAREVLMYFARLHRLERAATERRIAQVSEMLDMSEFLDRRCEKLSTGQKQRVNIARTILHDPPVLIFDEPTSGLDILAATQIVKLMRDCRTAGKCVVLSTHIMREAELLCDEIVLIHRGTIKDSGTVAELQGRYASSQLEVVFLRAIGEDVSVFQN